MTIAITKSQQLSLPVQDPHKVKLMDIPSWMESGWCGPICSWGTTLNQWQWPLVGLPMLTQVFPSRVLMRSTGLRHRMYKIRNTRLGWGYVDWLKWTENGQRVYITIIHLIYVCYSQRLRYNSFQSEMWLCCSSRRAIVLLPDSKIFWWFVLCHITSPKILLPKLIKQMQTFLFLILHLFLAWNARSLVIVFQQWGLIHCPMCVEALG